MRAYRIERFGSVDGVVLGSRGDPRPVDPSTKNEFTPDPAKLIGPLREKTSGL